MFPLIPGPLSPLVTQIRKRIVFLDFLAAGGVPFGVYFAGIADAMAKWRSAAHRTGVLICGSKVENRRIAFHGTSPKDGSGWRIFSSRSRQTCSHVFTGGVFAGKGRGEYPGSGLPRSSFHDPGSKRYLECFSPSRVLTSHWILKSRFQRNSQIRVLRSAICGLSASISGSETHWPYPLDLSRSRILSCCPANSVLSWWCILITLNLAGSQVVACSPSFPFLPCCSLDKSLTVALHIDVSTIVLPSFERLSTAKLPKRGMAQCLKRQRRK